MAPFEVILRAVPLVGLGICHIPAESMKCAVEAAIEAGYRHIDSAFAYPGEKHLGPVLKEIFEKGTVKREDMYIVSKLPWNGMRPDAVEYFCKKSLEALKLDYLDLYLIHSPVATKRTENDEELVPFEGDSVAMDHVDIVKTWHAMEQLVNKGLVKAIGLSNFNSVQILKIYEAAIIKPFNLQVECHAYLPQYELQDLCKKLGMSLTAYSPIGSPAFPEFARNILGVKDYEAPTLLKDEKLEPLAKKYNKTPAQILLRYLVQRGISVIPKSSDPVRIKQNIDILDFKLDDDNMDVLKSMSCGFRYFKNDYWKGFKDHPEYPFNIKF